MVKQNAPDLLMQAYKKRAQNMDGKAQLQLFDSNDKDVES